MQGPRFGMIRIIGNSGTGSADEAAGDRAAARASTVRRLAARTATAGRCRRRTGAAAGRLVTLCVCVHVADAQWADHKLGR